MKQGHAPNRRGHYSKHKTKLTAPADLVGGDAREMIAVIVARIEPDAGYINIDPAGGAVYRHPGGCPRPWDLDAGIDQRLGHRVGDVHPIWSDRLSVGNPN